ncbi:ferredoxin [Candidatus Woesearchaeota archaeon CG11_big_fil_rev_8_21_14_0_20_43_8]|nr:MAG: ferredoxin [Candidatus Woesearchaeota archaeon CG11_big_fil_rev_8_21_14_0_20_43_8]PIO08979.1 MAG: ferredoxin [Candidatus Woesearchaeota archaeon CG08_land_8_20_14_0_20_43_7]
MKKLKGWKNIPIGGLILEAGNAKDYITGSWRTFRPVKLREKCTNCLICFIYCPDCSIKVKKDKMEGFDYNHCKGCGICANVCPFGAIEMRNENEYQ